jgi:hypothetical protein
MMVTLPRGRFAAAALALALVTACGGSSDGDRAEDTITEDTATEDTVTQAAATEAAAALCPVMLDHMTAIGSAFNRAADEVSDLPAPQDRRGRWFEALDEMHEQNESLRVAVGNIDVPVLQPVVADILTGIDASEGVITDIRALFDEDPSIDEERHQMRTSQVIVRIEKVTSNVKPEMNDYGSPVLNRAFRDFDNCRNAVREVDDGATSDL